MALKYGDGVKIYDGIPLKQWKGDETRTIKILDDGETFPHSEHGDSIVFSANRLDDGFDPEKQWTLYVRPNSPMYYGALMVLTEAKPTLGGRTFKVTKKVGKERKDTRYLWEEVFEN